MSGLNRLIVVSRETDLAPFGGSADQTPLYQDQENPKTGQCSSDMLERVTTDKRAGRIYLTVINLKKH